MAPQNDQPLPLSTIIFKNLVMGGIAGIIGATTVYPLDMIKTRMQFQSSTNRLYNSSFDCLRKIISKEGIRGLYRGLPAQLVGITPEKAIKLTVNDLVRFKCTDKKTGYISIWAEMLAGALAGLSQVVATGPYELVKVRLQTQAQLGHEAKNAFAIVRELGFRGLFTGAGATLLRDIPFSAIYFASFGNLKNFAREKDGTITSANVFICGCVAGTIGALAATPMDVIKTRVQAKSGVKYNGIIDCVKRTLREEGASAFMKGAVPRMMIISPLFGITLMVYERLQFLFLPKGAKA